MDSLERERDHGAAAGEIGRAVDLEALDTAQPLDGVPDDVAGVVPYRVHAEALQVVHGGAQADRLGDRRRAGLEPRRRVRVAALEPVDLGDHVPATEEGGIASS